jgi:hypothetical protein
MLIELAVLFAVVALMAAIIVKAYEWRQDVLCGLDRLGTGTNNCQR